MAETVIVQTAAGQVSGTVTNHGYRFLGLDFAQAPVGELSFSAPRPLIPWEGVRPALENGATAPQVPLPMATMPMPIVPGDNCLNLNIFTPALGDSKLPTFFWVPGGAFVVGGNSSPWYDGSSFARDGVVFITANYRLGAQGFMQLDDTGANRGIEDLIVALQWVRDNIAAFGGDPDRVTIGGQSAGGGACAALLSAPAGRDLFRSAILMSGAARGSQSVEAAAAVSAEISGILGVEALSETLAALPISSVLDAQQRVSGQPRISTSAEEITELLAGVVMRFAPVIDGSIIAADELTTAASGALTDKTLLVGSTANEFTMMSLLQQDVTPDSIKAAFAVASLPEEAAAEYIADVDETQLAHVVGQVVSDRVFRLPAQELLDAHCEAGGTGFHYEFTWTSPNPPFAGLSIHGLDLPFEFDLLDADGIALLHGTNAPQQLASTLHEAWVGFIKDQDPGWPTYDTTKRISKIFDTENNLRNDIFADLRGRWAGVDTGYRRWR